MFKRRSQFVRVDGVLRAPSSVDDAQYLKDQIERVNKNVEWKNEWINEALKELFETKNLTTKRKKELKSDIKELNKELRECEYILKRRYRQLDQLKED